MEGVSRLIEIDLKYPAAIASSQYTRVFLSAMETELNLSPRTQRLGICTNGSTLNDSLWPPYWD